MGTEAKRPVRGVGASSNEATSRAAAATLPLPQLAPVESFHDFDATDQPARKRQKTFKVDADVPPNWRQVAKEIRNGTAPKVECTSRYRYSMVCSSNVNRSLLAHKLLVRNNFASGSYGTGSKVKLPGETAEDQAVFEFGTPYEDIYDALKKQNHRHYTATQMLGLMRRDATVKPAPERWQALASNKVAEYDVVFCFEQRVFDAVAEDMQHREPEEMKPIHVVSMWVQDRFEASEEASEQVLSLCQELDKADNLEEEAAGIIEEFQEKVGKPVLHQVFHI